MATKKNPSIEELRSRASGAAEKIPDLPPQSFGQRFSLAVAGGTSPEFRRGVVDPLLNAQRRRPLLQATQAEQSRQFGVEAQRGVVSAEQQQERIGLEGRRADVAERQQDMAEEIFNDTQLASQAIIQAISEDLGDSAREHQELTEKLRALPQRYGSETADIMDLHKSRIDSLSAEILQNPELQDNPAIQEALEGMLGDYEKELDTARGLGVAFDQLGIEEQGKLARSETMASALRPSPGIAKTQTETESLIATFDSLRQKLEANPKLGGTFEQLWPTFNPFTGVPLPAMFGGEIPEGQAREDFNSVVSNANAFIFKLRSGAAVTESEAKRLAPALPSIGLPAPINQVRIRNMTRFLEKNLEVLERRSQMVRDAGITDSNAEQRAEELQAIANQNPFTAVPFEADNDPLREALAAGAVPLGTTVHDIRDDGTMLVNVPGVGQRILRAVEE